MQSHDEILQHWLKINVWVENFVQLYVFISRYYLQKGNDIIVSMLHGHGVDRALYTHSELNDLNGWLSLL